MTAARAVRTSVRNFLVRLDGVARPGLAAAEWFDHDDRTVLSPAGTRQLVEAACRAHPTRVLDLVIEQEAESRHKCKFGGSHRVGHDSRSTSPEWEYDWYRRHDRPRHELLRQWCGHRAVTHHERFLAAEAETHRLDILVTDLLKALDSLGAHDQAARFAEEHGHVSRPPTGLSGLGRTTGVALVTSRCSGSRGPPRIDVGLRVPTGSGDGHGRSSSGAGQGVGWGLGLDLVLSRTVDPFQQAGGDAAALRQQLLNGAEAYVRMWELARA